jgi:hypothetical protein
MPIAVCEGIDDRQCWKTYHGTIPISGVCLGTRGCEELKVYCCERIIEGKSSMNSTPTWMGLFAVSILAGCHGGREGVQLPLPVEEKFHLLQ